MISAAIAGKPADVRVRVVSRLDEVGPAEWGRLAAGRSLYLSHPWLCSVEPQALEARYLLAEDDAGRLVGAYPAYLSSGDDGRGYDPFALCVEPHYPHLDRSAWYPVLLGGSRAAFANDVLVDPALSDGARRRVGAALLAGLGPLADALGGESIGLLHLDDRGSAAVAALLPDRPLRLSMVEAAIELPFSSFDGYLASLPGKARHTVRRERQRFDERGYRVRQVRLSECYEQAGPLLANLMRSYGHDASDARMIRALAEKVPHLDAHSVVFLGLYGGRIAGFSLVFQWEDVLYARLCGFDYDVVQRQGEYGTLVYYEPIRYAIDHGLRRLHLGVGSLDAKVLRGATLHPLWSAVVWPDAQPGEWPRVVDRWNRSELHAWSGAWHRRLPGGLPDTWTPTWMTGPTPLSPAGGTPATCGATPSVASRSTSS